MTLATKIRGDLSVSPTNQTLSSVIALTERCFVGAGDNLAMAVETLNGTKAIFSRLDTSLGEETGRELSHLISAVMETLAGIRAEMDGLVHSGDALRAAVRHVKAEVGELDRLVRSIASVSINARILGNVLIPPRPQVSAFIDRLAQMSQEGEAVLNEVKQAVKEIAEDTEAMELILQELRQNLLQDVLPALERIAGIAQTFQDGRGEMVEVSARVSGQMKDVFTEVSRLIMALQVGDSTRQRLQRVQTVLAAQSGTDHPSIGRGKGLEHVLADLARALLDAAKADARRDVDLSIAALTQVRRQADNAMQEARRFYFARAGRGRQGSGAADLSATLETSRDRVQDLILEMRKRAQAQCQRLDVIIGHDVTIRTIAHEVRLSGLNAVIICAKLGEEGRSLRELALWLRALIDDSDAIVVRLTDSLSETRNHTESGVRAGVDRLDEKLSSFVADVGHLNGLMQRMNAVVAETADGFDQAGRRLPMQIGQGTDQLLAFRMALGKLDGLSTQLGLQTALLARPASPYGADTAEAELLAQLRAGYTMQHERAIHDATVAMALAGMAGPDALADGVASQADRAHSNDADDNDLDDIFF
jgi:methyl-accepting chemotaxis protein